MLRVQLINEYAGSLIIETDDPIDINAITQTVKRSSDFDGVFYEVVFDFDFIKSNRRFIKQAFEEGGGIDANVVVNIYELNPNTKKWILYGTGVVNYNKYSLGEDRVTVNIEQIGMQRSITNMMDIDIDLETLLSENGTALPPQTTPIIPFHSKNILKIADLRPLDEDEFSQTGSGNMTLPDGGLGGLTDHRDVIMYGQFSTETKQFEELEDVFGVPFGWSEFTEEIDDPMNNGFSPGTESKYIEYLSSHKSPRSAIHEAKEAGQTSVNVKLNYKHKIQGTSAGGNTWGGPNGKGPVGAKGTMGNVEIWAWLEIRDSDDNIKSIQNIGQWNMSGYGGYERVGNFEIKTFQQNNIDIQVGDMIFVYETIRVYGNYYRPAITTGDVTVTYDTFIQSGGDSFIKISTGTSVPPSDVKCIMIHEAVNRCVQYITNRTDCFRSTLIGRTDLDYDIDGEGGLIAITNGVNIRKLSDKKTIVTLKSLIEFLNSLYCVGFGFETDEEGVERMVLERKEYFYDSTVKLLSLTNVADIKKELINQNYYNQIEYGYSTKVDVDQTNAIDEFNTIRRSTIPVKNTKNSLKVATNYITGGYLIENQRRLGSQTEDGKNDDNLFAVVCLRDGGGFKTKKNEGYEYVDVYSPETGYNYDISPARNLRNWFKEIASSLIYSIREKVVKFSYGEVNYSMSSKKPGEIPIFENGDVDISSIVPIWDNMNYTFENPLTSEQFRIIKNNPKGYIEFYDLYDEKMEGFIDQVEHDPNKGTASFKLLKVWR